VGWLCYLASELPVPGTKHARWNFDKLEDVNIGPDGIVCSEGSDGCGQSSIGISSGVCQIAIEVIEDECFFLGFKANDGHKYIEIILLFF
jgi:hypothetical protein